MPDQVETRKYRTPGGLMRKQIYYLLDMTGRGIVLRSTLWRVSQELEREEKKSRKEKMMQLLILVNENLYNKVSISRGNYSA